MALDSVFKYPSRPCGGGRAGPGCIVRQQNQTDDTVINVQGSAYGEALFVSPNQIEATWYASNLIGDFPGVGRVLFSLSPDIESTVSIRTHGAGLGAMLMKPIFFVYQLLGSSKLVQGFLLRGFVGRAVDSLMNILFMPAAASQAMYYEVRVFEGDGTEIQRVKNRKPMAFRADIDSIPPLGTVFRTADDVDFEDVSNNAHVFTMRAGTPGVVDEAPGLMLDVVSSELDHIRDSFVATIHVRSTGVPPEKICWFVLPLNGATLKSPKEAIDVRYQDGLKIPIVSELGDVQNRSGLIVQCFTSTGDLMENHRTIVFEDL